jgi:2-desacetyl-2-hydroxyethyl bacteriochlorophyllide A dehydrogenase
MRAVVLSDVRTIELEEIDEPAIGPHDLLVAVKATGICGSDMHAYRGFHPFRRPPVVLGHEAAGEVVAMGEAVERFAPGDRVALEPQIACGACRFCVRGLPNFCTTALRPGMAGWGGTFTELIRAPESTLHRLGPRTTFAEGAMVEPAAVALRAFRRGAVAMGHRVAVLGCGNIGGVVAHLCQRARVSLLMVTDIKPFNLEFVSSLGPCVAVNASERDVVAEGRRLTDGEGFDVVLVASGAADSMLEAVQLCAPHGRIVCIAIFPEAIPLDATALVYREAEIRASFTYTPDDFRGVIALLDSGSLELGRFVTRTASLDEAAELFMRMDDGMDYIKVLFQS